MRAININAAFFRARAGALLSAAAVFVLLLAGGEMVLRVQLQEQLNKRHIETLSHAATVRARIERELSAVLYLNSGLGAYLALRNNSTQANEVQDILRVLHEGSRHVRNFAVAIGFQVRYVHPLIGNEKALGLNYPDLPEQWPLVEQIARSGVAALAGPVDLVQGGRGLAYRVPLMVKGRYWGLLSTVIDSDSLFRSVLAESASERFEYAIRGKDGLGMAGGPVWASLELFEQPGVVIQEMEVPGGRWAIAVRDRTADDPWGMRWLIRLGAAALGLWMAVMLYLLIRSRGRMAHQAMYDDLTGLPNRRLLEDRAVMALSRQQRQAEKLCALLFFDLDDFKLVNDQHGHKAGDAVLAQVARRAVGAVRQNDTVARWGGDEFIVLLENISRDMLETIIQRLRNSIQEPVAFEGHDLRVGVSVGMAICQDAEMDLDQLLRVADEDMYHDKLRRKSAA